MTTTPLAHVRAHTRSPAVHRPGIIQRAAARVLDALAKKPKYQWMITQDLMPHESGSRVIHHGPEGARHHRLADLVKQGRRFRMLDASGVQKLSGFILGSYKGPEPLLEYGQRFGCIAIDYAHKGGWVRCAEFRMSMHKQQLAVANHALAARAKSPQQVVSHDVKELSPIERAAAGFLS